MAINLLVTRGFTIPSGLIGSIPDVVRAGFRSSSVSADYTVSANISGSGTTSPGLPLGVVEGTSLLVNFLPAVGWEIGDIAIDGVSVGAVSSFNFTDIFSNFVITVTFTEIAAVTFPIDVEDNVFGIISPGGIVNVPTGLNQIFSLAVSQGYEQTFWVIDGVDQPAAPTFSFINVIAPHTIGAKLQQIIAYSPRVRLLKTEEFVIKRRNFDRGSYDTAGYRNQGPLFQTFKLCGTRQPGQTQSGILQAVGEQIDQKSDYDYVNKSWKIFTFDPVVIKDIFVLEDGEYEVLDVDDWTNYGLRSNNFRSMIRKIKPRG